MIDGIRAPMIESGNWLFAIGYLVLGIYVMHKTRNTHFSDGNEIVLRSMGWVAMGGGLNAFWFSLSRHLAETGEKWNTGMFEYRWFAVIATAMIFAWGVCGVLRGFEDASNWAQAGFYATMLLVATTFGIY